MNFKSYCPEHQKKLPIDISSRKANPYFLLSTVSHSFTVIHFPLYKPIRFLAEIRLKLQERVIPASFYLYGCQPFIMWQPKKHKGTEGERQQAFRGKNILNFFLSVISSLEILFLSFLRALLSLRHLPSKVTLFQAVFHIVELQTLPKFGLWGHDP